MLDPNDRAEVDEVETPIDIYYGDDTYIVYDEDGEQYCYVYGDDE